MTITPFLTLKLRGKRDALFARQRARRVANLLSYDVAEQACIAAGTFVVACQALERFGKARLLFQIDAGQLQVFAQDLNAEAPEPAANRITGLFQENEPVALYRLVKQLPADQNLEQGDLGWLVRKVEETACDETFTEIVKQNQEMLAMLHELRICRANFKPMEEKTNPPHAA